VKGTLRRDLALVAALVVFVVAVAVGMTSLRNAARVAYHGGVPASLPAATVVSTTPRPELTPRPQLPAADLVAARLTNIAYLVMPLDLQAVDAGRIISLVGAYADTARTVLIFRGDATKARTSTVMVYDDQGMLDGSSSGVAGNPPDNVYVLDTGPHPRTDGVAHLKIEVTSWQPAGNLPQGRWNFSVDVPVQPGKRLPALAQFQLGRWKANIETLELTPTVVHLQAVINGASLLEIGLSTITLLDPAGQILGQGCGASITVPKTQISSPNSPLYHNARVYCEFDRPASGGAYQIRFQGGGGSYQIPVSINALGTSAVGLR
jgi:hypothetical protein